nr:histone deacetylase complex subunit SAP18 isoform X1 [Arachis hypogaea]
MSDGPKRQGGRPLPPPPRGPPGPPPPPPRPRVEPVDREKTCPLLLRVFTKEGSHHTMEDFAVRGKEPSEEVQIYTWKDATLRELTELVKEVVKPARRRHAKLSFAFVFPDKNGRFKVQERRYGNLDERLFCQYTSFYVLCCELHAIWRGLVMASDCECKEVICKTDNLDAFLLVSRDTTSMITNDSDLLDKIKEMLQRNWTATLVLIQRTTNKTADLIAKTAALNKQVGKTLAYGNGRFDDGKALAELGFEIGDYLDVAIL